MHGTGYVSHNHMLPLSLTHYYWVQLPDIQNHQGNQGNLLDHRAKAMTIALFYQFTWLRSLYFMRTTWVYPTPQDKIKINLVHSYFPPSIIS